MAPAPAAVEFDVDREESFVPSLGETHAARTKRILRAHPEIRSLIGRNPWTGMLCIALVAAQFSIATGLGLAGTGYWWLTLILAYGLGAFASHALYVVIHDATHNLVFSNRFANRLLILLADMALIAPGGMGFRACHLTHHAHCGEMEVDADIPSAWEARLVGHSTWRKALWFFFFPAFQALRVTRTRGVVGYDGWTAANVVCNAAAAMLLVWLAGANALFYLLASFWFSIGLHPLGARWVQEHFTADEQFETASYYGPLNLVALNVGYHNEHHDFPSIPWNRLPQVTRIAPEFYRDLPRHPSWTGLMVTFITDPRCSLWNRTVRPGLGQAGSGSHTPHTVAPV